MLVARVLARIHRYGAAFRQRLSTDDGAEIQQFGTRLRRRRAAARAAKMSAAVARDAPPALPPATHAHPLPSAPLAGLTAFGVPPLGAEPPRDVAPPVPD